MSGEGAGYGEDVRRPELGVVGRHALARPGGRTRSQLPREMRDALGAGGYGSCCSDPATVSRLQQNLTGHSSQGFAHSLRSRATDEGALHLGHRSLVGSASRVMDHWKAGTKS